MFIGHEHVRIPVSVEWAAVGEDEDTAGEGGHQHHNDIADCDPSIKRLLRAQSENGQGDRDLGNAGRCKVQ